MQKNILTLFLEQLSDFPLWVKQLIYLHLHNDLAENLSEDFIYTQKGNLFCAYIPHLSVSGFNELQIRKSGYDCNIYNFLDNAKKNYNMLEISMNNFWTLEETAKYFIFSIEQNYIDKPESQHIFAMAAFMAGKFRTGEYFVHIGKISNENLSLALSQQKNNCNNEKLAEILISLGYITEKDCLSLIRIKEEAKKRFVLNPSMLPKIEAKIC